MRDHPFPPQTLLDAPSDIPDLSADAARSQPGSKTDPLRLLAAEPGRLLHTLSVGAGGSGAMIIMGMEVLLSIVLGSAFLASAVPKLRHPRGFILAVLEYRVLPPRLGWFYARLIPPLEFLVALLLLTGIAVRSAAAIVSMLLLSFIVAVGINLARGRDLDCHCFGKGTKRPIGWKLLLQDAALLGAAIALVAVTSEWVAPEPWSVFQLSGLVQAESPLPLLGCAAVTVCTAVLLSRSIYGRRRYGSGVVSK